MAVGWPHGAELAACQIKAHIYVGVCLHRRQFSVMLERWARSRAIQQNGFGEPSVLAPATAVEGHVEHQLSPHSHRFDQFSRRAGSDHGSAGFGIASVRMKLTGVGRAWKLKAHGYCGEESRQCQAGST